MPRHQSVPKYFLAAALAVGITAPGLAADLPKATAKVLKELDLKSGILKGLDQELALPKSVLGGARKEGTVTILGSWTPKEFRTLSSPFKERYPFIKVKYNYGRAFNARAIKPLIAYKEGRYIADALTGFGGSRRLYKKEKAFEDLRALPGFKNALAGNDPKGSWMAIRNRYWCMAYNTKLLKKSDLPKTWDDLLTNPSLHNGKLGVANRPQLWLLMLWKANGKAWVENYIDKFFTVVKPQFRKEGLSAMTTLVVAGEVSAAMPSGPARVQTLAAKGAPIAWHCPEPLPRAVSRTAVLKGAPHKNAAKVWANWLVSKEGQISQFAAEGTAPSHRDLQMAKLLNYSEQIYGRKQVTEDATKLKELKKIWGGYWKNAPKKGKGRKRRKSKKQKKS
jgi:iron(III) transport system substrate-binding protein